MNDNVHDLFREPLSAISGDIPERPLQPPHRTEFAPIPFNEYDDAIMHDILGKRFGRPVQDLLEHLHACEMTSGSFGLDTGKAWERFRPLLIALRQACKEEWEDIR